MRLVLASFLFLALIPVGFGGGLKRDKAKPAVNAETNAYIVKEIAGIKVEEDRAMQECVDSKGKDGLSVLNRIYHPDMVFVTKHGALIPRTQRIADLSSGNLKFISFGRSDYSYYVYDDGNTVVQTGIATSDVIYHGKEDKTPRRFTNVFIKLGGQWRLVAHQATTIAQP